MEVSEITSSLQDVMGELEHELASLIQTIKSADIIQTRLFHLPRVKPHEEYEPYGYIIPELNEDAEALDSACNAYVNFHAGGGEATKVVFRLPGVIVVRTDNADYYRDKVAGINQLKDEFSRISNLIEDQHERFDIVHRLFPRLIHLQVTRHLCLLDKPLYSINFTWGRRPLSQKVTKHDVIKLLEKMKKGRPLTAHDSLDWPTRLNAEIAKFALLPEDIELRLKRDMKLHPLANLLYQEKDELGRRIKRQTSNHTPLLVLTENKPPKLGHLKSYDPDNPKRYRPKKISDERITPYLPVFRIEKEQSEPVDPN